MLLNSWIVSAFNSYFVFQPALIFLQNILSVLQNNKLLVISHKMKKYLCARIFSASISCHAASNNTHIGCDTKSPMVTCR
jgi:hypothetical protein